MADNWYNKPGWSSTAAEDTAANRFSPEKADPDKGSKPASSAVSLALIFWNEMRLLDNSVRPPMFDGGYVTESLGNGKYKVKLMGKGSVVTATATGEQDRALFPWQKQSLGTIKRGALVLLLVSGMNTNSPVASVSPMYTIIAIRQSGAFAPKEASEYEV